MVVVKEIKPVEHAVINCELILNSRRCIRYVAPLKVGLSALESNEPIALSKRSDLEEQSLDAWEGVSDMCRAIDDIMEIERETDLLDGKSVLEIGFCTGLPSVFAFDSGASEVTLHCWNMNSMEQYVKQTLRRNNVPRSRCKFTSGEPSDCVRLLGGKKFDIIIAPEFTMVEKEEFGVLHQILDAALAPNGVILLSGRAFYKHCSGSRQAFLDLVKIRGRFDAIYRWTSFKVNPGPRKVIQMVRTIR